MEFITLNNKVVMPMLGFGTYQIKGDECVNSVLTAINSGYRLIDTAEGYRNEEEVGEAIKKSGINRNELFITTKVRFHSYENAEESVNNSLKYLNTDYLDLVLLHWPFANYYKAYRVLEKLYKKGIIRAIGVSNFNPDRLIDLIGFNEIVPAVNQIETHLLCQRQIDHEWLNKLNVSHEGYTPLGQNRKNEMFEKPIIKELSKKYNKTPAQIALRFLLSCNIAVIPKSVHENRIKENIDVFDFNLLPNEIEKIKLLDEKVPMIGNPQNYERAYSALTWDS